MNSLDLPPRRRMPPNVRDRLRDRLAEPPGRTQRLRGPLAVAAGVALLAAGAVMVSQSTGDTDSGPADPPPTTTAPADRPDQQLDRCWAALEAKNLTAGFPDRAAWRPVINQRAPWVEVTGAMAGDRPLFCQTTTTTVTISAPPADPVYAEGSRTGVLLRTQEGVLAGVADPSWQGVGLILADGHGRHTTVPTIQEDGLFVLAGNYDLTSPSTTVEVYDLRVAPPQGLPVVSAPSEISIVDRPNASSPEEEQDLDLCLEDAAVDPAGWVPGAGFREEDRWLVLARNGNRVASCYYSTKSTEGYQFTELANTAAPGPAQAPRRLLLPWGAEPEPVVGVVSAEAAYVRVEIGGHLLRMPVVNSTFLVVPQAEGVVTKVFVYDENDKLLYEGPFA